MRYNKGIIISIIIVECIVLAVSLILNRVWLPLIIFFLAIPLLLTAKKPIWGLLLFILFMFPSRVLPIATGVSVLKVFFVMALGAYIINSLLKGKITVPEIDKVSLAIYILAGVVTMSLFYSIDLRLSFHEISTFIMVILIYLLIASLVNSSSDIRLVQQCLMISAIISVFFMFFAWTAGGFMRKGAFEADPNFFALSLIMTIPITINEVSLTKSKLWKVLSAVMFLVIIFATLATFSRGGLVTLIVVMIFMFSKTKKSVLFVLPIIIISGFAFAIFVSTATIQVEPLGLASGQRISALVYRLSAMRSAFHVFMDHPLFGVGVGNFIRYYHQYSILPSSYSVFVAHNMYLEILANLGLIGFIPFSSIIILSYIATLRAQKAARAKGNTTMCGLAKVCQGMLLTFIVGGLFLGTQFYKHFWIALALSVVTEKVTNKESSSP